MTTFLQAVPPSAELWQQFLGWWAHYHGERGQSPPWGSSEGIWVAAKSATWQGLVSGCQLYAAKEAPVVIVEGFCTNPEAPGRIRLRALEFTIEQIVSYAATTGRAPVAHTNFPTLIRKLRRFGFGPLGRLAWALPRPVLSGTMSDAPQAARRALRPRKKPPTRKRR